MMNFLYQSSSISDKFVYSNSNKVAIAKCYHLTKYSPLKTLILVKSFQSDTTSYSLFNIIHKNGHIMISQSYNASAKPPYKSLLIRVSLQIINEHLVYLKPILKNTKYLSLFVIPESLQQELFYHYHTGSSGGNMG